MYSINYKSYSPPPFRMEEALRYARSAQASEETVKILNECFKDTEKVLTYKVCWLKLPINIEGSVCDFDLFTLQSSKLAENLHSCTEAVVFAATTGIELDRLISKYSRLSPVKALMFQAIGAERIEALCDTFCKDMADSNNCKTTSRFSPGYGDLKLECQKELFAVLDCERKLGLTLNQSLLMSPSKSVTAIMGIVPKQGI